MKLLNYYYCYHSYYYLSLYCFFFVWWRLEGYHGLRPGVPYIDPTPDYVLISASESNGYTNLQFERETTTEEDDDPHDVQYRVRNIQRADSIKVALGIGNWALARKLLFGGHSGKSLHCSVCPNDTKCPKQPLLNQLYR